jgi:hypothetical protein
MHGIHDRSVAYSLAATAGRRHLAAFAVLAAGVCPGAAAPPFVASTRFCELPGFVMALHWTIDTRKRLIVATAEGEITAGEVRDYLAMVAGARVQDYRQLFDFSGASANFSPSETLELGVLIQVHQKQASSSALAVVMPDRPAEAVGRLLGIMATAQRPMRLFSKPEAALKWLGEPIGRRRDKGPA